MKESEDNQFKLEWQNILVNTGKKFDIISCKWLNDKEFEIKTRTEIERDNDDYNALCDDWVETFSSITQTLWAKKISNTGPKIKFRKQYQCWTQGGDRILKEYLFDPNKCKAVLDIKVLTDTPLTRRKNKHIRMGLNAVVKINFIHLHNVDKSKPYGFFVHHCQPVVQFSDTNKLTESSEFVQNSLTTKGIPTTSLEFNVSASNCQLMFDRNTRFSHSVSNSNNSIVNSKASLNMQHNSRYK